MVPVYVNSSGMCFSQTDCIYSAPLAAGAICRDWFKTFVFTRRDKMFVLGATDEGGLLQTEGTWLIGSSVHIVICKESTNKYGHVIFGNPLK